MTAKELREFLAEYPDDTPVLVDHGRDHGYSTALVRHTTALLAKDGEWSEDYGEKSTPERLYGKRLEVFVIV